MERISILINIYNFLRKHYPIILGIFFASLICINIFVYYQYVHLAMETQTELNIEKIVIDQETLEKVLSDINEREENLSRVRKTQYYDPFND